VLSQTCSFDSCEAGAEEQKPASTPSASLTQSSESEQTDFVMLPTTDGFMEWQKAPELAEVINAWFNLSRAVVDDIFPIIRDIRR
jgi:hypothetical protein